MGRGKGVCSREGIGGALKDRKTAVITHGKNGGYIATFPDREQEIDRFASILAQHCIIIGYSVKYELQGGDES